MPKQQDPQLRKLVDQFVADLTERVHEEALETVRGALGRAPAPKRSGSKKKARKARKAGPGRPRKAAARQGGRRSAEDVAAVGGTVLAHVRANPGQRLEEIGRDLGVATKELKRPISNLMEAKALRTEGQKRGTRYFAGGGRGKKRKAASKKRGKAKSKAG
jgi:hypothetical protein